MSAPRAGFPEGQGLEAPVIERFAAQLIERGRNCRRLLGAAAEGQATVRPALAPTGGDLPLIFEGKGNMGAVLDDQVDLDAESRHGEGQQIA